MIQFLTVLREFHTYGGSGVVYGGCLRDTYCGVGQVKDIDIAVSDTSANRAAIESFIAARGVNNNDGDLFAYDVHVTRAPLVYGNFPDVIESISVEVPGQLVVNFVILDFGKPFSKELAAERCDFGICQIALDEDGLFVTEAFERDYRDMTFTYTREPFDQAQYDRSLRRWERFSAKFEGWRLVVPAFEVAA